MKMPFNRQNPPQCRGQRARTDKYNTLPSQAELKTWNPIKMARVRRIALVKFGQATKKRMTV